MNHGVMRPWCALARYPGLDPFHYGTVSLRPQDGEEAARIALAERMLTRLPPGFEILSVMRGSMVFQGDDV